MLPENQIEPGQPEVTSAGLVSSALLLTRIRSGNAYEETVERLLQTIRLGLAHPGDQLPPERELALLLEVSRDTVRDAISSLVDAGYLVIRRGRYGGTFIAENIPTGPLVITRDGEVQERKSYSKDEIQDVMLFRQVLEPGAAYLAASSELTGEMRDSLWQAHLETNAANVDDYRRLDSRLHLLIAELSGSNSLVTQIAHNRMRVNELLNEIPLLPPNLTHSNDQHQEIVMAILTGQADVAQSVMRDHVSGSAALLRGFLG
jgi:DNA-binding FadR family transcriptional regulator